MFENDKENGFFAGVEGGDSLDLGSNTGGDFADFSFLDDENIDDIFKDVKGNKAVAPEQPEPDTSKIPDVKKTENEAEGLKNEEKVSEPKTASNENEKQDTDKPATAEVPDLFEAAVAKAEEKQAESTKSSLTEKLPVFSYASVKEEIVDTSKTFDQLRNEKAEDFPELDDGTSVTWKVEYGKIIKTVPSPKKTTIAGLKSEIENSKEFLDSLKKAKGEIKCKVTPSVTAKKKGVIAPYKGVFNSIDEAAVSGTAKLETVDMFGKKTLCGYSNSKSVDFHNDDSSQGFPKNERCTRNFLGKRSGDGISGCICRFCKCGANGVCRDEGRAA